MGKICYYTPTGPGTEANAYTRLSIEAIESQGYEVRDAWEGASRSEPMAGSPVVVNWFEEVNHPRAAGAARQYIRKRLFLRRLQRRGADLYCVIHNRQPHDVSSPFAKGMTMRLRRRCCALAKGIVILCDETEGVLRDQLGREGYAAAGPKIAKIPHPSYLTAYRDEPRDYRGQLGIGDGRPLLLFSGLVRPYKNIELIIDAAHAICGCREGHDAAPAFVIAGRPCSEGYLDGLIRRAGRCEGIYFLPEFIPDENIRSLVEASDAMVLPYDKTSSLNSSSCILAFTYGRTVICPRIGTIKEFPGDLTYAYDYADEEGHLAALIGQCERFLDDFRADGGLPRRRGGQLAGIVNGEQSLEAIGGLWAEAFASRRSEEAGAEGDPEGA